MISQGPSVCVFNKQDPQEVLASWLFTQYLLTNEVQIAYSETEGYVPVTSKAQDSAEYQDYLSRAGEDNNTFYDVKIAASKLLLTHAEDTFVTAVFNGSASLRDAAGQLIEDVTKSVRRKRDRRHLYREPLQRCDLSLSSGPDQHRRSRREKGSRPPAENFRGPSWRPWSDLGADPSVSSERIGEKKKISAGKPLISKQKSV